MGGGIGGGVAIDNEPSPRRAAIEKTQEELRQEFVVREERRRELEFLEKGGNPLDFKFTQSSKNSFLSPTETDPLAEQNLTSEGKSSFALNASPNRESAQSNGRPETLSGRDLNTADNFAGDTEGVDTEKPTVSFDDKGPAVQEGQLLQPDGSQTEVHVKESEDSGGVRMGVKGYARRNRHRSNRTSGNSSIKDVKLSIDEKSQNLSAAIKGAGEPRDNDVDNLEKSLNNSSATISKAKFSNENGIVVVSEHKISQGNDSTRPHGNAASVDVSKKSAENKKLDLKASVNSEKPHYEDDIKKAKANCASRCINDCVSAPSCEGANKDSSNVIATSNCMLTEQNKNHLKNDVEKCLKNEVEVASNGFSKAANDLSCINGLEKTTAISNETHDQCVSNEKIPVSERTSASASMDTTKEVATSNNVDTVMGESVNAKAESRSLGDVVSKVKTEESSRVNVPALKDTLKTSIQNSKGKKFELSLKEKKTDSHSSSISGFQKSAAALPSDVPSLSTTINPKLSSSSGMNLEVRNQKMNLSPAAKKAQEDVILEEAKIINAKRLKLQEVTDKRPKEPHKGKSHWDYVLEEMAWMANDFMQERLWKVAAAAQFCRWIAEKRGFGELRLIECDKKQRENAHILAASVIKYWKDAEKLPTCNCMDCVSSMSTMPHKKLNDSHASPNEVKDSTIKVSNKQCTGVTLCKRSPLERYAMRFLINMKLTDSRVQAEAPPTPERLLDVGIMASGWEDQFPEESLFYLAPFGAMATYRNSVETYWASHNYDGMVLDDNTAGWTNLDGQTGIEGSDEALGLYKYGLSEYADDTHSHSGLSPSEKSFYGDDDEMRVHYLPGAFDGSKASKARKRKKSLLKTSMPKSYIGRFTGEESYDYSLGNKAETNMFSPSSINGKKIISSANMNVGMIPTKRIRSSTIAARQRASGAGTTGASGFANKTDVSSGDTSSLQDDTNTVSGGSQHMKSMDMEPSVNYGKRWQFEGEEISARPKKKKKSKHLGTATGSYSVETVGNVKALDYEHKWQQDVTSSLDQREQFKRKADTFSTTNFPGSSMDLQTINTQGIVQPPIRKQKLSKQLSDMSPEVGNPGLVSAASPVASQLSNMSNSNKLIKMIANRDRGKKSKQGKVIVSQTGIGVPWSTFEDQALVVLVHDFGPNWDLVSDIINSSLQIKSVFRKPRDCEERHRSLVERNGGDGGDSPEDSGSSQPYPPALPGIPKGSARMLLQRLQGPMEEDTLRKHFDEVVKIGRQHHVKKFQSDNQEQKRIPVHPSHMLALSNLPASILTPLDLCDHSMPPTEVSPHGYQLQSPHASGLGMLNHLGTVSAVQAASGVIPSVQGTTNLSMGANLTASAALNGAVQRDVQQRFSPIRPMSVCMDDQQQRMQQYNHMMSARNLQAPGMIPGMSRGMPMPRPGQVLNMGSPGLNNMLPGVGVGGMSASTALTSGPIPAQGHMMPRSRDSNQMLRPGQSPEDQRQALMQELQLQSAPSNGHVMSSFSNQASTFPNHLNSSPTHNFSSQHQHQMPQAHNLHHPQLQGSNHNHQQQAYMYRQQMQRPRYLQPQQFPPNGSPIAQSQSNPHSQSPHAIPTLANHCHPQHPMQHMVQHQHPIMQQQSKSPSPPNLHQQSAVSPSNAPMLHASQKRQLNLPQTIGQNQGSAQPNMQANQIQKHLSQRQHHKQTQQHHKQSKVKGMDGATVVLQNLSSESGQSNLPPNSIPSNQHAEKADQIGNQGQQQRFFTGQPIQQTGKQAPQPSVSGQQGQNAAPTTNNSTSNASLSHSQKGHLQQQPHGNLSIDSHQTSSACPTVLQSSLSLPASQPQASSVSPSSLAQPQQNRQMLQNQQPAHRKIPLRQTASDAGVQSSQLNKNCAQQKEQVMQQTPTQTTHLAFQIGSNVINPLTTASSASVLPISSALNSNSSVWKTMQNIQHTGVPGNVTNHSTVSGASLPSVTSSSGMYTTPLNGNAVISTAVSSSMLSPGTPIVGVTQRQYTGSAGAAHSQNASVHSGLGPMPSQQVGVQWESQPPQSVSQQQRQGHNVIQSSNSLGTQYVDPPPPSTSM